MLDIYKEESLFVRLNTLQNGSVTWKFGNRVFSTLSFNVTQASQNFFIVHGRNSPSRVPWKFWKLDNGRHVNVTDFGGISVVPTNRTMSRRYEAETRGIRLKDYFSLPMHMDTRTYAEVLQSSRPGTGSSHRSASPEKRHRYNSSRDHGCLILIGSRGRTNGPIPTGTTVLVLLCNRSILCTSKLYLF